MGSHSFVGWARLWGSHAAGALPIRRDDDSQLGRRLVVEIGSFWILAETQEIGAKPCERCLRHIQRAMCLERESRPDAPRVVGADRGPDDHRPVEQGKRPGATMALEEGG